MDDDELLAFDLEGVERTAAQQKQLSDQQRQPGSSAGEVQDHVPGLQQFAYSRAVGQENRPAAAPPVRESQHRYAVHIPTASDLLKASVSRQNGLSCSHAGRTDPYYQEQQPHGQQACQPLQQPHGQQACQPLQQPHGQQACQPLQQPHGQQACQPLQQPHGQQACQPPQQPHGQQACQPPQEQAPQTLPHWPPQQQWHHNPLLATAQPGVPGGGAGQHNGESSAGLQGHHQEHKLQPWLLPPQHQQHQPPPAHTQQQASQQQQQNRPSWNQQQFGQMQHNRQQQYPNPHRPQHQQHPGGMPPQVTWQQRLQQQQQEKLERLGPAAQLPIIPRCPHKRCPGLFSQCGAVLRWIERRSHNFWSCSRYPHCEYKYFPAQQLPNPELGCEVVDSKHFKLAPQPAAEVAVRRAGGIRAVLAAANIQFAHLEIAQQHHQQQEGGDSGAEASAPAADADADAERSGGSGAGVDDLASGPMWDWSADESLLLPLCQYEVVESVLRSCRPPLLGRGGAIPQATLAAFREPESRLASEAEVSARFDAMPASLRQALMPFQREGVLYGLTRHGRVLIADEMGVGKTMQALALAACYQEEWPLLVVVPASLRLVWAEEIERWLPHIRPGDVTVIEGKDDRLNDLPDAVRRAELPAITITSYEMMKRLTCPACQKLQGAAAAAAARAAKARQAEAAACNSTAAAAASEAATVDGSNPGGTAAAAQACGARGSGGGARGRGRGRGRGQVAAAPVQDSVVTWSKEVVWDVSETGGCSGAGDRPGGRAGKRCHGCTGPDHCMAALPWGVVIIDESHNLRTTNSRQADSPQTEAAVAAAGAAPRVILLSGTPSLSRPYDLFRQVDVLQPGILGRAKEYFAHRYCDRRLVPVRSARAGPGPGGDPRLRWNNAGGARLVELHGLLVRRVMVRRLKKDVLTQLPPKRRQVIRLPHPPAHRWPKEETQAEQQQQGEAAAAAQQQQQEGEEQDDQQQGQVEGTGNAAGGEMTATGSMTAAHRVALAKLPDAIEWLMAALGSGSEQQQDGGRGSGKQGAPHDTGLAGPGRAPSGRLKPLWQGGSSAGYNSSGGGSGGISRANSGQGSVDAAAGAAGQEEDEEGDEEQQEGQSGQQSGGTGPKFLVFAHHKDVMDKLAAALAGYGSHLPDSSTAAAPNHSTLDPDLAVEVVRQAARDSSSAASGGSSAARQGWRGVEYVRVDGSHDSAERHAAVKRFKTDPSCRVALLSITAAAVGLDFSAASMVVFVELPHEVSLVRQAEDRAHRKGQAAKAVNVYFLCAQGTVDDKHWQALNLSLAHISAVHDGEVLPQPLARATARAPAAAPAGDGEGGEEACGEASRDAAGTGGAADAEGTGEDAAGTIEADAAATAAGVAPSAAGAGVGEAGAAAAGEGCSTQQPGASGVVSAAAAEAGEDAQQGVVDLTADSPVKPPNSSPKQPSPHRFRPLTLTPSPNGKARRGGTRQSSPGAPPPAAAVAAADAGDAAAATAAASPGSAQAAPGAPGLQEGFEQDGALVPSPALQQLAAAAAPKVLQPSSDENFCAGGMCLSPMAPEVWFEVSKHTNRLHYHLAADGSRPLGLNIPLESLLLPEEGTLQQLAAAWDAAWQEELKQQQQQQPQVQPLPAVGQTEQPSSQQQAVGGGGGDCGGGSQAKVASPFFARQLHHQTAHQQQQQAEAAVEVVRHTQEAQQQDLQQQVAQTPAAPACAATAAATPAPAPGRALDFAALASGSAAASHATPAAPASVSQVPVSTSSRGRPIPALESLRSLMPFGHSAVAPAAAAVGCASVGASVQAGPVDTAVSGVASSHATPGAAANADVQVVSATPSPTAAPAAAGAAATSHQRIAGGSPQQQQQQQQEDAAKGTAGMQQHVSSDAPTCSQGMVQSSPGLMQRMRRLLSQSGSQQQHEEERRPHAEPSPDPAPVPEQQEQQQCSPWQGPQQQDDDDAAVGSPAGLVLHLDDPAEQQPAAAVSNEVIVIPARQDTVDELASQQQEQQAVQHVDLLSQSPLGKVPQHHGQQQEQRAEAAESRQQQQQQQQEQQLLLVPATGASDLPDCRSAAGFLSPSGLACLTLPLSPLALLELLRQGAAFAADWSELRSVTRNRLVGRVLPPDLASAVEAATAAAASAGAFGVGTTRYLQDIQEGDPNLPAGARLTNVSVHYPNGRQQLVTYRQAFTGGGADASPLVRHCINCFKAVEGAVAAEDAVLQGSLDLFCSLECERSWSIKSSSGGIRRALFKLERGVCRLCHLDCHALVAQLQQIAKDSPHWLQHRRAVVAALAPKMLERGYGTLLDRLLNQATEGNAWHADHIVAVYEGGGGCELDNLRTLCVACHAAVTKKQAAARAAERQRRKLGTADIRLFFGGLPAADSSGAGGLAAAKPKAGLKRKRRAKVEGSGAGCVDDLSTPEEEGDKVQPWTAAGSAAGAQDVPAAAGPQGKPAAAAGARGKPAATAATGKKRARPPKKQKGAGKAAAAAGSKASGQIQKWVASAAAASQGTRAHTPQPEPTAAAAAAAAAAEGVTRSQPDEDAVIELLDDSQPGLDGASPTAPDSAAAALNSTPQSQRRAVKRPAAAAAEALAAGHGLAGLRTVLDQFRFSQEDGSSQGQGASGLRGSRQQLSTQPSQQHQQRQQQQQGKKRKAPSKLAANKRRTVGRDRKQQARLDSSDDGSESEWSVGAG